MKNENLDFNKSIVKYFMDFLETDFHKRTIPKRKIVYTNSANMLVGCNLKKYDKIEEKLKKMLNGKMDSTILSIKKNEYVSTIKSSSLAKLNDLVRNSCEKRVKDVNKNFIIDIDKKIKSKKFSDIVIINDAMPDLLNQIELLIIDKFIEENFGYLCNIGVLEQDIITIKASILNMFESCIKDKLTESFEDFRNGKEESIKDYLDFLNIDLFQNNIVNYFSEYNVSDLFNELNKMNASKKILDKQEFYFSLYDMTYNKIKYPIFYIPFELEELEDEYKLKFDAQMYINKKSIEYIIQELKETMNLTGKIDSITERIMYLNDLEDTNLYINKIINDITNYFSFSNQITDEDSTIKNDYISISSSFYFNIFDNSDDALVNDYEELLQLLNVEDSEIANMFQKIIEGFMTKNPESITENIREDWENLSLSDKLVFKAPVPLNEEQIKILKALENDKCKYVTVQGPPGTGKSHTITAIIFDMILKDKSVLVLSDKKEALDVVEDKITSTLNKARFEENFQNPILRLGKTGSTYNQILSQSSIDNIKASYKVLNTKSEEIEQKINKYCETIKDDIDYEQFAYDKIKLEDILEFEAIEDQIQELPIIIDKDEIKENGCNEEDFETLFSSIKYFSTKEFTDIIKYLSTLYSIPINDSLYSKNNIINLKQSITKYKELIDLFKKKFSNIRDEILKFGIISNIKFEEVEEIINVFNAQNSKIFKFAFKNRLKNNIILSLKNIYPDFDEQNYIYEIDSINNVIAIKKYLNSHNYNDVDYRIIVQLLNDDKNEDYLGKINEILSMVNNLEKIKNDYPKNFGTLDLNNLNNLNNLNSDIQKVTIDDYRLVIRYITLQMIINDNFSHITLSKYNSYKSILQNLVTLQTTKILDGRVINFYENNISTAKILRKIIQKKQKFPKNDFEKLKNAFPCILAGIRDYAEYIPLQPEIFDLIIIDEASQVSIAQALPALIRAKKVLVLGDKKQFSNVKSNQAKIEINNEYKNIIKSSYIKSNFYNPSYILKLDNFDIKASVLDFFESISNYQTMLYKYFRGYKEIISYSNKYFYDDKLQVMKIRGKSIDEVIKFHEIKHDGKLECAPKTNKLECDYIISELKRLLKEQYTGTVGIITPHTNQQKLLILEIRKLPEYIDLEKNFNLKVMTFDSCQGEERDIIYYSMVANKSADSLWGVFPKDFKKLDLEEDGNLRAQRLNVGFSRPKESMCFVISQPLEEFDGEIGNALRHYKNILEIAKQEKSIEETDKKSAMEPKVMEWFYQTKFWLNNSNNIEFKPQFELGKYLKQLDPYYKHPLYCVDFLLLYNDNNKVHKIIIEYDGFREHFKELENVDLNNYNDYYKEDDIYRQKVLESYGYKFLRINKFNVGKDPVYTLESRLNDLINEKESYEETFRDRITKQVQGLSNGSQKECPNCNRILDISCFKDENLLSGIGRICNDCKQQNKKNITPAKTKKSSYGHTCPKCGRRLMIRNGVYGRFLGCSGYPYCKYTKNL